MPWSQMAFRRCSASDTISNLSDKLSFDRNQLAAPRGADARLIPNSVLPYGWMLFGAIAFSIMAALTHALGESWDWQIIAASRTALALVFATALTLRGGAKLVF